MREEKHTPGIVSRLPQHSGDGYSWGGDIIVTFGDKSINLGPNDERLAHLLAAAPALLNALWVCVEHNRLHLGENHNTVIQGLAAIAKAQP